MTTLYYSHQDFFKHDPGFGHPECAERLESIDRGLKSPGFEKLVEQKPPLAVDVLEKIALIHTQEYIDFILKAVPDRGYRYLDGDTVLSPGSGKAALRAVSAVCDAVDRILAGDAKNAFCAVRPPGHHALPNRAMGFCLFNNVAIAAAYARRHHRIKRIAIVDFDVHHGNGTQAAFEREPDVLYASSHQMPAFPGSGYPSEKGVGNIINAPLPPGSDGIAFRRLYRTVILPAVSAFKPDMLLVSAGFDAHRSDPLAFLNLVEDDYRWVTRELVAIAEKHCNGRMLSVLEGGYDLHALAACVAAHLLVLLNEG